VSADRQNVETGDYYDPLSFYQAASQYFWKPDVSAMARLILQMI